MYILLILTAVIFTSVFLTITAEYSNRRLLVYIFKPLTTSLIILVAFGFSENIDPFYQSMIVLGLCFSLAGDVFLMLPSDRFIPGLVSFLIAHLFYIAAFSIGIEPVNSIWLPAVFMIYAIVLLQVLAPHLGRMKFPVLVYATIIAIMGWQAVERWLQIAETGALLAMLGAVSFIVSDSALAYDRFVRKFKSARAMVLITYFLAQWLIALSA